MHIKKRDLVGTIEYYWDQFTEGAKNSLEAALEIGRLLNEQKAALPHGGFLPWLTENVRFISQRTCYRWMHLDKHRGELKFATVANLADAFKLLAPPKDDPEEAAEGQTVRTDQAGGGDAADAPDTDPADAGEDDDECDDADADEDGDRDEEDDDDQPAEPAEDADIVDADLVKAEDSHQPDDKVPPATRIDRSRRFSKKSLSIDVTDLCVDMEELTSRLDQIRPRVLGIKDSSGLMHQARRLSESLDALLDQGHDVRNADQADQDVKGDADGGTTAQDAGSDALVEADGSMATAAYQAGNLSGVTVEGEGT